MGHGSYSYEAHQAITAQRAAAPAQQVFSRTQLQPLMDPKGVKFRESRDSAEHPNTTSVIFALDVSGSMGAIPHQIAKRELPTFMKTLLDTGVTDPQVLFMAFQDCAGGVAPLQVGQFESTAELMDQWLTWCWLMGGGASEFESYDLALYFAAHHTKLDSLEKRGKKGYLFMTGDETCYPSLKAAWVKQFLGAGPEHDLPLAQVVSDVKRSYHTFYLIPDPARGQRVQPFWAQHLGDHAITLAAAEDVAAAAAALVALNEGAVSSLDAVGARLSAMNAGLNVPRILGALRAFAASIGKV